ncbi:MAG: hypothetical protein HQ581_19620 [Planctomycetes bacterium]|nr:hypothetical protein [Planctomycetota bacterium]
MDSLLNVWGTWNLLASILGESAGSVKHGGGSTGNARREYTDSWFYPITVIGLPTQQWFPDEDWLDYRLKLFQAVYKGRSSW